MTAAITTIILLTTAIMTITTSTTTAMVMMAWLLLLLLLRLWLVILRRYTVAIPMVEQVRANFDVRFHLLVVFAGQITTAADRWFPAAATKGHRLVCTCTFNVVSVVAAATTITAAAIQSIRLASLFVEFHIS